MFPNKVDVTAVTGEAVAGPVTSWIVPDGKKIVEHLAGPAPDGDVLVFWWAPGENWKVVNVTKKTGKKIASSLTNWTVPDGKKLVEHLAGSAPNGDLLVFWWAPGGDWKVVNVSEKTGKKISGPVTSWTVPDGSKLVEHLAGAAPNGDLLVYWWASGGDWEVVNVTEKTGKKIRGPVTSWTIPEDNKLAEYLAGRAPNGDLLVFRWAPGEDWKAVNLTPKTGKKISGPVSNWTVKSGNSLVEHLAGPDPNGDLLVFWRSTGGDWKVVDVTRITGVTVNGTPIPYQVRNNGGNDEILVAQGKDNSLNLFWWNSARDWQSMNLREGLQTEFTTPAAAWTVPDGSKVIEHVAAVDPNCHLVVGWFDSEARRTTDALHNDFPHLTRQYNKTRKVVVVFWDGHRPDYPTPSRAAIEKAFVGGSDSVKAFFGEASLKRFNFEVVAFLPPQGSGKTGWYDAKHPWQLYWREGPYDPKKLKAGDKHLWVDATGKFGEKGKAYYLDDDGFIGGHSHKYAEAVWSASADFDFSKYDVNKNGTIDPDDLGICVVQPSGGGSAGFQRGAVGRQLPTEKPLKSKGLDSGAIIPSILEIYLENPPHIGLMSHEYAHLLVGAADLYHGWPPESKYVPFTVGPFSLMATGMPGNLDPFHRLKYGWLRHRLVTCSGHYSLRAAIPDGEALILMNKAHSTKEYFILENRWKTPKSSDSGLPDTGLAVWHVIEGANVYSKAPLPSGTEKKYWSDTMGDWSRRVIRLIRPVVANPTDNKRALWDGKDPQTGYDLLPNDPNPQHSQLRWIGKTSSGVASGFAIRNISAAGPVMEFDIQVPW